MIRTRQDYRDITYEYLMGCARQGAIYVELIASPDHAANVGLGDEEHFGGIAAGIDDARRDGDIEGRILVTAVRNFGVERAVEIARTYASDDRHPYIVGFNLAGDEAGYPAAPFAEAYAIASAGGLGCTCHAGEHDGAESVRQALALPGITRISHGVRAIEDPALVDGDRRARHRARGVPDVQRRDKGVFRIRIPPIEDASRSGCEAHVGF